MLYFLAVFCLTPSRNVGVFLWPKNIILRMSKAIKRMHKVVLSFYELVFHSKQKGKERGLKIQSNKTLVKNLSLMQNP